MPLPPKQSLFFLSLSIFSQFLLNFQSIATPPILPLPRSNLYHLTRLDVIFPTVPLPPNHCHSPPHCHPNNHFFFLSLSIFSRFLLNFQSIATLSILPLPRSNLYHSTRLDVIFPTVPLPPNHCHSPCHCHPNNHFFFLSLSIFFSFFA
jgi:hypothetical protein